MSVSAEIIADSVNSANGARITSWILEYPRFLHAELLTHRMFSKNAASSRAIPIEKMIQMVMENPAMPEFWGKNQPGMQANEELDDLKKSETVEIHTFGGGYCQSQTGFVTKKEKAKRVWLEARDSAVKFAKELNSCGVHKQIVNRILEPFFHIKIILTGTEFENFFALRAHSDAQPEFKILATKMLEKYNESAPKKLNPGDWHIPFGDKMDEEKLKILHDEIYPRDPNSYVFKQYEELKIKIACARCARVSYWNFEGKDDYAADVKLCDRLFGSVPRHLSPTEHVTQAVESADFIGNFRGFKQFRKFFEDENLADSRVIKKN